MAVAAWQRAVTLTLTLHIVITFNALLQQLQITQNLSRAGSFIYTWLDTYAEIRVNCATRLAIAQIQIHKRVNGHRSSEPTNQ